MDNNISAVDLLFAEISATLGKIDITTTQGLNIAFARIKAKQIEHQQITEAYRSGVEDERYDQLKLNGKYYELNYGGNNG